MGGGYRIFAIVLAGMLYAVAYCVRYRHEFFVEPEIGFRLLYGFIAMMIGSLIYDYKNNERLKSRRAIWLCLGVASCGGFLMMKLLLNRIQILMRFQFMTQVFGVAFAVFMMLAGIGYEMEIQKVVKMRTGRVIELISACSLEIYLVQFAIIGYLKRIIFPVNLIVILVATMGTAYLIHRLSNIVFRKIFIR